MCVQTHLSASTQGKVTVIFFLMTIKTIRSFLKTRNSFIFVLFFAPWHTASRALADVSFLFLLFGVDSVDKFLYVCCKTLTRVTSARILETVLNLLFLLVLSAHYIIFHVSINFTFFYSSYFLLLFFLWRKLCACAAEVSMASHLCIFA